MRRGPRTIAWFVPAMLALAFGSASAADQALLTQARALFKAAAQGDGGPVSTLLPPVARRSVC